jgi:hypothetical protein
MQERDAHVLADKVRRLVQGARGVQAVTPVHTNPQMDAHGWTVRVARAAQHGGDVRIFGSDHGGFRTMEQAGSAWAPVVFLAADRSDAQHIAHDEIAAGRSPFHLQAQLAEVPRAD